MKKGKYKIIVCDKDGMHIETRQGYLFNARGLSFGVCKERSFWRITEIQTGMLIYAVHRLKDAPTMITADVADRIRCSIKYNKKTQNCAALIVASADE